MLAYSNLRRIRGPSHRMRCYVGMRDLRECRHACTTLQPTCSQIASSCARRAVQQRPVCHAGRKLPSSAGGPSRLGGGLWRLLGGPRRANRAQSLDPRASALLLRPSGAKAARRRLGGEPPGLLVDGGANVGRATARWLAALGDTFGRATARNRTQAPGGGGGGTSRTKKPP